MQKYIKYNIKLDLLGGKKNNIGGNLHKHILLIGASSVGKSTIADFLNKKNYVKICIDDYWFNDYSKKQEVFNYIQKNIAKSNEYFPDRKEYSSGRDKFFSIARKIMYENGKDKDKVVYDDFNNDIVNFYENKNDIFVILVYAPLYAMMDNLLHRRFTDWRSASVLETITYICVATDEEDYIDILNRADFIDKLKENFKHDFVDEENLLSFANDLFKKLEINDDKDHKIKIRDTIKYDYLLNVKNKTKGEIFEELSNIQ